MIVDMRISYLLHHDGRRGIETKINAPFLRHGEKGGRESQKKTPTPRVAILIDVSIATAAIWHGVDILFYDDPSVFSARPYPQHRSGEIDYPWNSGYADQRGGGGYGKDESLPDKATTCHQQLEGKERETSQPPPL